MYVYCLIKYPDGEPMIVEISPSSVAEAPDTTYSASHTSTAKPSVTPINSALMAYHAQVRQKRSLEEPSGEKPNASAMKYRAVGPLHDISSGKVGANSGNSARVSTFSSPPRTLTPPPTFALYAKRSTLSSPTVSTVWITSPLEAALSRGVSSYTLTLKSARKRGILYGRIFAF